MPRYFFHVVNDVDTSIDEEGNDLPNLREAIALARETLGSIIAEDLVNGKDAIHLTIMVDDHEGRRAANLNTVTTVVVSESPFAE